MRKAVIAGFLVLLLITQRTTQGAQDAQPPMGDPVNGKLVFTQLDCVTCHGVDAVGGWGPDLAGKGITYAQTFRAVRFPIWRMPMFIPSQLSDKEIADMVAYWGSLPRSQPLGTWRREMVSGTAPLGQQLAVNVLGCAQCHTKTVDLARRGAGEVNGDFEWFKRMVYDHQATQAAQWKELDASAPMPPTRARVRMGKFFADRIPEATLREVWNWMTDIGLLVPVQARLTAGAPDASGTTYTLDVTNAAVPGKGLTAEDATISLIVPAGMHVVSATGTGYRGVARDETEHADVATWQVPKIAPRDQQRYTITLVGTAASGAIPKGHIGWARPVEKEDALVQFALQQAGGRAGAR
jgi:mono/diheme cytochrome c family protein